MLTTLVMHSNTVPVLLQKEWYREITLRKDTKPMQLVMKKHVHTLGKIVAIVCERKI